MEGGATEKQEWMWVETSSDETSIQKAPQTPQVPLRYTQNQDEMSMAKHNESLPHFVQAASSDSKLPKDKVETISYSLL